MVATSCTEEYPCLELNCTFGIFFFQFVKQYLNFVLFIMMKPTTVTTMMTKISISITVVAAEWVAGKAD